MIINGIEYAIRLWFDDESNETIIDEVFSSFDEMNGYIEKTYKDPQYEYLTAMFSPVEVINGEPEEVVTFIYELSPYLPLDPAEIEDYLFDFEEDIRVSKEISEEFGQDTKFEPQEDAVDYESKRKHRQDITYICPHCFRELEDCRCSVYPYHLVQIDKLIVPIIRTLNKKGYITSACCSGHAEEDHCLNAYIAFKNEHNFGVNLPVGATYVKTEQIVKFNSMENLLPEERLQYQEVCIKSLTEWANSLPAIQL